MVTLRWTAVVAALGAVCCGGADSPTSPSPRATPVVTTSTVRSVTDGDTLRLAEPFMGATSVRLVNIDAPELGGDTQEPWATAARDALHALTPEGTPIRLETGADPIDGFGRVLAMVIRGDGLDVNRELVRQGRVVTYIIWPNAERVAEYRTAQAEAQRASRGIWAVGQALRELPFEYRQRSDGDAFFRPVGDSQTRFFVEPADYARVHVNNRVFFPSRAQAVGAGYTACPRTGVTYSASCFALGS